MEICSFQTLTAYKETKHGMYLQDEEGEEVLLPSKFVPADLKVDDEIEVFIYYDSQDREIATTQKPIINPYGFAYLDCVDVAPFGAFMDWGLDRDLLIPNAEQAHPLTVGQSYLTYLFVDEQDRITGTTHVDRCFSNEDFDLKIGDQVDLLVYQFTDMGVKVVIDDMYTGLLYRDQVQAPLRHGDRVTGYISKIRAENKLDVSLHRFGYNKVIDNKDRILEALNNSGGFLPLHDKSEPDKIKHHLQISKKVFKKAIGGLYKDKRIRIEPEGIYLIK